MVPNQFPPNKSDGLLLPRIILPLPTTTTTTNTTPTPSNTNTTITITTNMKKFGIKSREVDNPEFRLCDGSFPQPYTIVGNLESRFVPGG